MKYINEKVAIINKLKEENETLKNEKNPNIDKKESKGYKNLIINLKDFCKKIGLEIRKESSNDNIDTNIISENKNQKMENIQKINQKKEEYEKK